MKQKQIDYSEIMSLGFTEEFQHDKLYENRYGFPWAIVQKKLTDTIYLDWEKENRLCKIVRHNPENGDILGEIPIVDFSQLNTIVRFFCHDDLRVSDFEKE